MVFVFVFILMPSAVQFRDGSNFYCFISQDFKLVFLFLDEFIRRRIKRAIT